MFLVFFTANYYRMAYENLKLTNMGKYKFFKTDGIFIGLYFMINNVFY